MPRDKVTRTFLQMFNIFVDQRLGADLKKFVAFAWNSNGKNCSRRYVPLLEKRANCARNVSQQATVRSLDTDIDRWLGGT